MLCCSSDSAGSEVLPVWRRNAINQKHVTLSWIGLISPSLSNALKTQRLCPDTERGFGRQKL